MIIVYEEHYLALFKIKNGIKLVVCSVFSSGGPTRTSDLWVMSPTSYQLLYPAMYRQNRYPICDCKDRWSFLKNKFYFSSDVPNGFV